MGTGSLMPEAAEVIRLLKRSGRAYTFLSLARLTGKERSPRAKRSLIERIESTPVLGLAPTEVLGSSDAMGLISGRTLLPTSGDHFPSRKR